MRCASALSTDEARRVAYSSRALPPDSIRMTMAATQYSRRTTAVPIDNTASRSTLKLPFRISRAISAISGTAAMAIAIRRTTCDAGWRSRTYRLASAPAIPHRITTATNQCENGPAMEYFPVSGFISCLLGSAGSRQAEVHDGRLLHRRRWLHLVDLRLRMMVRRARFEDQSLCRPALEHQNPGALRAQPEIPGRRTVHRKAVAVPMQPALRLRFHFQQAQDTSSQVDQRIRAAWIRTLHSQLLLCRATWLY